MSERSRIRAQGIVALLLGMGASLMVQDDPHSTATPAPPDFGDFRIKEPESFRQERGHPLNPGKKRR